MGKNLKASYILKTEITLVNVGTKPISTDYSLGPAGSGLTVQANNLIGFFQTAIGYNVVPGTDVNNTEFLSDYYLTPGQALNTTEYFWVVGQPDIFGVYECMTTNRNPFAVTVK